MMRLHKQVTSGLWVAGVAIAAAVTASVYAQSTQPPQSQPQQNQSQQPACEQQTEPANDDAAAQQTPEPLPDIDSQAIEPGARANGRFIPT